MAAGPGQVKQLTGSALDVGLLGATELLPLVVFGLYGGVLADRFDRRLLARWSEAGLGGGRGGQHAANLAVLRRAGVRAGRGRALRRVAGVP